MIAVEDANIYLETLAKQKENKIADSHVKTTETNEYPGLLNDTELLTHDDVARANVGLPPQRYNAYLLFDSDNDINFATEILTKMETEYKLKVINL